MAAARAGAGMGPDIGEARLDLGAAEAVGRLGLPQQGGALDVGREHHLDQRLGSARRLLGDGADPRVAGERHMPALGHDLAPQDTEKRRLAGAIAAHEPDARSRRQGERGLFQNDPAADAVGEVVHVKHAAFWRGGGGKASCGAPWLSGRAHRKCPQAEPFEKGMP